MSKPGPASVSLFVFVRNWVEFEKIFKRWWLGKHEILRVIWGPIQRREGHFFSFSYRQRIPVWRSKTTETLENRPSPCWQSFFQFIFDTLEKWDRGWMNKWEKQSKKMFQKKRKLQREREKERVCLWLCHRLWQRNHLSPASATWSPCLSC